MSDVFAFVVFTLVVVGAILLITGKLAEWTYEMWKGSRFEPLFLAGITDLRTLKVFYRILGFVILAATIFVYIAALLHRS